MYCIGEIMYKNIVKLKKEASLTNLPLFDYVANIDNMMGRLTSKPEIRWHCFVACKKEDIETVVNFLSNKDDFKKLDEPFQYIRADLRYIKEPFLKTIEDLRHIIHANDTLIS